MDNGMSLQRQHGLNVVANFIQKSDEILFCYGRWLGLQKIRRQDLRNRMDCIWKIQGMVIVIFFKIELNFIGPKL